MRRPKPLYEILPVLCVSGGSAAMTAVGSFTSFVSGVLMGISGVVMLSLRRNQRARQAPAEAAPDGLPRYPSGLSHTGRSRA